VICAAAVAVSVASAAQATAWGALIDACPHALVQHTWAWREVLAHDPRDTPVYLLATDADGTPLGGLPACHVRGPMGDLLLSLPQAGAYGGVLLRPDLDDPQAVRTALVHAFVREAEARGCLLATLATPPFAEGAPFDALCDAFRPDFVRENFYQHLDLATWPHGAREHANVAKYVRRARAAAERHGLTLSFAHDTAAFTEWEAVHAERMAAIGAARLPSPFLHAIRSHVLDAGLGFLVRVRRGDALLAGGLFVGRGDVLDAFLLAGTPQGDRLLASSVVVVAAIEHAAQRGFRRLNWQSCSSRDSGVYHFKAKWGSAEGTHHYLTRITGDIDALRRQSPAAVRAAYPWRYVMPFEAFTPTSSSQS
jgi:hypothetical protein